MVVVVDGFFLGFLLRPRRSLPIGACFALSAERPSAQPELATDHLERCERDAQSLGRFDLRQVEERCNSIQAENRRRSPPLQQRVSRSLFKVRARSVQPLAAGIELNQGLHLFHRSAGAWFRGRGARWTLDGVWYGLDGVW